MSRHHIYSDRVILNVNQNMLGLTEGHSTDSAVVGLERVIFHVDHKMLGLTEALSTDSAVVGQAVHVVCYVHS